MTLTHSFIAESKKNRANHEVKGSETFDKSQKETLTMNRRRSVFVAAALLIVGLGTTLIARAAVEDGLAARWLFNESYGITARDSGGAGLDGTLFSSAFFTNDPDRGNVLFVNGASGEVQFPNNTKLKPNTGTISVWVKPDLDRTADIVRQPTDRLIGCDMTGNFYAFGLRVTDKGGPVAILANDDRKTCSRKPQVVLNGSAKSVRAGQWTHLVMRWDGSKLALFANGKSVGSTSYVPNPTLGLSYSGTEPMKVGAALWDMGAGYLEYFGKVSDLRIYSRPLSDSEIQDIPNGR